jgi:hypothetical protein
VCSSRVRGPATVRYRALHRNAPETRHLRPGFGRTLISVVTPARTSAPPNYLRGRLLDVHVRIPAGSRTVDP